MPEEKNFANKRLLMYVLGFIFNLSSAIPAYINSTFIAHFVGTNLVGIIYAASSLLTLGAFIEMSGAMRRFGNMRTTIGLLLLELLSLAGLVAGNGTIAVISAFALNFVAIALVNFALDVFLEEFSVDSRTGKIRGAFLSVENSAWLVAPLIASWILGNNHYGNMYAVSGLLLIPVIFLIFLGLRDIKEPAYEHAPFWKSFALVWADRDLKGILFIQFLLQFFYAWMTIYTPIYLNQVLGFSWPVIGVIFMVMLVPFVLLEGSMGRFADRVGEKRLLMIGFVIMGLTTAVIAAVTDHDAIVWAAILFTTRIGAAIVEVMSDAYFFKHVDATKSHAIMFSRMARPLAYVISPVVATILFTTFDMKGLFVFLGLLMFYGVRYALSLKDTRVIQA